MNEDEIQTSVVNDSSRIFEKSDGMEKVQDLGSRLVAVAGVVALVAGSLSVASAGAAGAAGAASTSSQTSVSAEIEHSPQSPSFTEKNWRSPRPSADYSPDQIVSKKSQKGDRPVQLVAARAVNGKPVFTRYKRDNFKKASTTVENLQKDPALIAIEEDRAEMKIAASNDTHRNLLWALDKFEMEDVWETSTGDGIKVAVVDTGVAPHNDLAGTVLPGLDATGAGGSGRNDGHGHGTHVAGTIAATANNSRGIAGVSPNASIIPVKVLSDSGLGQYSWVSQGVTWAVDNGADVINMSLGGPYSSILEVATAYAISQGVTVVASAGNSRQEGSPTSYPAAYPGVIGVGATQPNDAIANFSNQGSYVDITAPGTSIYSTLPSNNYASWQGTSMAAPHVAGAAALVLARQAELGNNLSVSSILESTASDKGPSGWDGDFGHGIVDPRSAVAAIGEPQDPPGAPTGVTVSDIGRSTATVSWQAGSGAEAISYKAATVNGNKSCNSTSAATTCQLTNLDQDTNYSVKVTALGIGGNSPASIPSATFTTGSRVDAASDLIESPTSLPDSLSVDDPIDVPDDLDYWTFTQATDGQATIDLKNLPANTDYDLALYSNEGNLIVRSQNWWQTDEKIERNLNAGTYIVLVFPYLHSDAGVDPDNPYRLTVEVPEAEVPDPEPEPPVSSPPEPEPSPPAPTLPPAPSPTKPPAPRKVKAVAGNKRIRVSWRKSKGVPSSTRYQVRVIGSGSSKKCLTRRTTCTIKRLKAGRIYKVKVTAIVGKSKSSSTRTIRLRVRR